MTKHQATAALEPTDSINNLSLAEREAFGSNLIHALNERFGPTPGLFGIVARFSTGQSSWDGMKEELDGFITAAALAAATNADPKGAKHLH